MEAGAMRVLAARIGGIRAGSAPGALGQASYPTAGVIRPDSRKRRGWEPPRARTPRAGPVQPAEEWDDFCLGCAGARREARLVAGAGGGRCFIGRGRLDPLEVDLVGGEQHADDEEAEPPHGHDQEQDPGDDGAGQLKASRVRGHPGDHLAPLITAACRRDAAPGPRHPRAEGHRPPVRPAQHGDDQDDQSHSQDPCGQDEVPVQQITQNALRDLGVVRGAGQRALLVEDDAPFHDHQQGDAHRQLEQGSAAIDRQPQARGR